MCYPSLIELPQSSDKVGWPWTESSPQLPNTMPDGSPWPRISIVTPCLNRASMICDAIESVLAQNYPNFEHIIIDGGSTDGTLSVLAEYPHLQVISEPDNGLYDAVNKGIRRAVGDLVGWLNSDDVYEVGVFHIVAHHFIANPHLGLLSGDATIFQVDGCGTRQIKEVSLSGRRTHFDIQQLRLGVQINACFITRELHLRTGAFKPIYSLAADREFLIRLAIQRPPMLHIGGNVYHLRFHEGSLTFNDSLSASRRRNKDNIEVALAWLAKPDVTNEVQRYCQDWCTRCCFLLAAQCAQQRQWVKMLKWFRLGLETAPVAMTLRSFRWVAYKVVGA